jgi:hypothetical protein
VRSRSLATWIEVMTIAQVAAIGWRRAIMVDDGLVVDLALHVVGSSLSEQPHVLGKLVVELEQRDRVDAHGLFDQAAHLGDGLVEAR